MWHDSFHNATCPATRDNIYKDFDINKYFTKKIKKHYIFAFFLLNILTIRF